MGRGIPASEEIRRLETQIRHSAAAETTAVALGRKPLYHEQVLETDAPVLAQALRQSLSDDVGVTTFGPHVYAWKPTALQKPIEQAHAEIVAGRGGRELGYGADLMEPGNVTVHIIDPRGQTVAGFRTPATTSELYAQYHAENWTLATGEPHSWEVF